MKSVEGKKWNGWKNVCEISLAILSFSKTYGNEALERTCKKALEINTKSVSSIESILKRKTYLEKEEMQPANNDLFNAHENIRGADTYQ